MIDTIGRTVVLVRDYDEARDFYAKLGFETLHDQPLPDGRRFLHVGLSSQPGVGLWLLEPAGEDGAERIGRQTGGEPLLVLYTGDLAAAIAAAREAGVDTFEEPQEAQGSAFIHFADLYGNHLVLVELRPDPAATV
ncbi:VOC family protein [Conexibacter woesei]|uniref:Glyoxalase/bleomycin resistance protein/dioxygenase n=1 Tax=Conexibacter woesei (strain DSM 14684 / CCUG 47730 / CIP 108061 / JCM 11494 / NBRC 100937 / ID131577) TaxID=469383 RepID=D3FBM9_CONWI|nr:VOC family protein [Conexibacter woesei]ADB49398.1 Glyoxalase/bleomycin resistance protein/dioxygenase [Conexibacter woesei DSM 14684]